MVNKTKSKEKEFKDRISGIGYWIYGLVKDNTGIHISEVYFKEKNVGKTTKTDWLFYYPIKIRQRIRHFFKIRRTIKHQKKVMKYFEWDVKNKELVIVRW